MEVAKYAAEVRQGTVDMRLKSKNVFCIALAGYYLVYNWDANSEKFQLAKAYEVPDRSEIWANEVKNRECMKTIFGLEFPEEELSKEEASSEKGFDNEDELPFGE